MKDSTGREIQVGDEVAYNRSGDVIRGQVLFVGSRCKIHPIEPNRHWTVDYHSWVRNGRSILVLS